MASKVEALVRNFLKTDGDALYLVPGEKIFLVKGTNKLVVGREPLSDESFRAVAAELVPGAPAESLSAMRHRVSLRVDEAAEPVEIQFGKSGASHAIMIGRVRAAEPPPEPDPEPEPQTELVVPPPIAALRPAPAPAPARPAGGTASYGVPAAPRPADEVVPIEVPDALSSRVWDAAALGRLGGMGRGERPLEEAIRKIAALSATDLHVVAGAPPAFRVAGELVVADEMPALTADELEKGLTALLTDRARKELETRGAAVLSFEHPGAGRLRARMSRERGGLAAQFRRIASAPPKPGEIGVPPATLRGLAAPHGLILVAGPPGSGKTTTRAALLAHVLGTRPVVAVLVEDPAEVPVPRGRGLVLAREVGSHGATAAEALRNALGEDAELLAAPEPRDAETAALILDHASRRLVLVEVTAASVSDAIERLTDLVPEGRVARTRELLAGLLRAVLVQRLVTLADGTRLGVFDLLLNSGTAAALVREGKGFQLASIIPAGRAHGMTTVNEGLADLVKKKVLPLASALAASPDPAAFKALVGGEAPAPPAPAEPFQP